MCRSFGGIRIRVNRRLGNRRPQPAGLWSVRRKIFVGAVAEIGEREDSHDRGSIPRRQAERVRRRRDVKVGAARLPGPDIYRLDDVLEAGTAGVDKGGAELLAGLPVGVVRRRHAAGPAIVSRRTAMLTSSSNNSPSSAIPSPM